MTFAGAVLMFNGIAAIVHEVTATNVSVIAIGWLLTLAGTLALPGWGWSVASGVISVVLGFVLMAQWPQVSVWFLGFAVGVNLILDGWALLMFAAATKKLSPSSS